MGEGTFGFVGWPGTEFVNPRETVWAQKIITTSTSAETFPSASPHNKGCLHVRNPGSLAILYRSDGTQWQQIADQVPM